MAQPHNTTPGKSFLTWNKKCGNEVDREKTNRSAHLWLSQDYTATESAPGYSLYQNRSMTLGVSELLPTVAKHQVSPQVLANYVTQPRHQVPYLGVYPGVKLCYFMRGKSLLAQTDAMLKSESRVSDMGMQGKLKSPGKHSLQTSKSARWKGSPETTTTITSSAEHQPHHILQTLAKQPIWNLQSKMSSKILGKQRNLLCPENISSLIAQDDLQNPDHWF